MRPVFKLISGARGLVPGRRPRLASTLTIVLATLTGAATTRPGAAASCVRDGGYDGREISESTFFTARQQTKFSPGERHYPLARQATARYCFSRGCAGQLPVSWTEDEQQQLRRLRDAVVAQDTARAELKFIKIAVLQMETWLYARLKRLDQTVVTDIMRRVAGHYGNASSDDTGWVTSTLGSFDRFDKECATYAMEATQHLLVLANLGLMKHWNVTAPVYRFGFPGHWTAGLENRETCERYRFDLNTRASMRYKLHVTDQNPAQLALDGGPVAFFPGMDNAGRGRPTLPARPDMPAGASALKGPPPAGLPVSPR